VSAVTPSYQIIFCGFFVFIYRHGHLPGSLNVISFYPVATGMAARDQTPTEGGTTKSGAISLCVLIHPVIKSSYPLPIFIALKPTTAELYLLFPTHLASIRVLFQPCQPYFRQGPRRLTSAYVSHCLSPPPPLVPLAPSIFVPLLLYLVCRTTC